MTGDACLVQLRRERIAERMRSLQELVPNSNKVDKASMLDDIIDYVKFLQLQVKVSRGARVSHFVMYRMQYSPVDTVHSAYFLYWLPSYPNRGVTVCARGVTVCGRS